MLFLDLRLVAIISDVPFFAFRAYGLCVLNHLEIIYCPMWLGSAEDDVKGGEATVFLLVSTRADPGVKLGL